MYLEDRSAPSEGKLKDILDGTDLIQHAVGPTHRAGHTLDVVISQRPTRGTVHVDPPIISDHSLIAAEFYVGACAEPRPKETTKSKRLWKELDVDAFRRDILSSKLNTDLPDDVSAFFSLYDSTIRTLVDKHVPTKDSIR